MKWITREKVKVDRVTCTWLIRKFVDPKAEFLFVPANRVIAMSRSEQATPYDVPDVEFGHHGKECSFEAILDTPYPALNPPQSKLRRNRSVKAEPGARRRTFVSAAPYFTQHWQHIRRALALASRCEPDCPG